MSSKEKALGTGLENRVVKRATASGLVAHKQPLSGVLKDYPNDVVVEDILVECKVRSRHPSYTEMLEWLLGCQDNAKRKKMRDGILVYNTKGSQKPKVLCDLDLFLSLLCREMPTFDTKE